MMTEHLLHFFRAAPDLPLVQGYYQPSLVLLSVSVAVALSWLALLMAESAQHSTNSDHKRLTVITGAIALGAGIWTMHFIGMFAYHLPATVRYEPVLTFVSMLPALAAAWATLSMLTKPKISKTQLIISSVIMGAGIGAMHYMGMLAIDTPLQMHHDLGMFLVSIVVAVGLALLAIGVRFGLQSVRLSQRQRFWLAGLIMGCAIAGMHYTAMVAVRFYGYPSAENTGLYISTFYVALAISSIAVTIATTVAAINSLVHTRELNRQVQIGKQRMVAIFDTAVDAIITIDAKGIVQEFSLSAERIFGYQAHEVRGHNVKMLMPEPYRNEHDGYLRRYINTQIPHIIGTGREVVGQRKDGSTFPMRLAVGRVNLPNDELLFVGLVTDISDKKALEESLRETAKRAEQAAAAKTRFLANMSHEIRTPMNAIIGFTDILLGTELSSQQQGHLNTIRQASRSLLGLLNDILDTTKLESGKVELEVQDFSITELAEQLASTMQVTADKKGLDLNTHFAHDLPPFFKGDALRLRQVLTNLVGNALKFTEQGGVTVAYRYEQHQLHICVSDTGIGMNGSQLAAIFDAFTQADASINRRFGGTGLGTTISRQLVEAMGGYIKVDSELGEGSQFHVWLPLPLGEAGAWQAPTANVEHSLPALKILIADDIAQNLELLTLVLTAQGHGVICANDGNQAVDKFKQTRVDIVLMDVHMPHVDGLQATRLIREYEQQQGLTPTPIIALTASVLESDRKQTEAAGMNGFAVKPLEPPALFAEIARLLGLQSQARVTSSGSEQQQTIHWQRGISLWGNKETLTGKIREFIHQSVVWPESAQDQAFRLHGIKGVAGNLGLMPLSHWAGEKEQQARAGQSASTSQLQQEFEQHLARIVALLPEPSQAENKGQTEVEPMVLSADITQLQQTISANELDDELLARVISGLNIQQGQRLQNAIDDFDFAKAAELLASISAEIK